MSNKTEEITLIENAQLKNNIENIEENIPNKKNILMENDFIYIDEDSETEGESSHSNEYDIIKNNNFNGNNEIVKNIDDILNKNSAKNENKIQIKINTLEFKGDESSSSEKQNNICAISNNNINKNNKKDVNTNPLNIEEKTKSYEENKVNNSYSNKVKATPKDISTVIDVDEEDPYNELQAYLEKIKREINDVFEEKNKTKNQQQSINSNKPKDLDKNHVNATKSLERNLKLMKNKSLLNNSNNNDHIKELRKRVGDIDESKSDSADINDVNIWATELIKELGNLVGTSNDETSHPKKYNSLNIVKPAKHATIPLQSFKLDIPNNLIICNTSKHSNNKVLRNTILKIEEINDKHKIPSKFKLTDSAQQPKGEKISQIPASDQSNLVDKKNSISSNWKTDESILKNIQQNDEDTKSTSSSICDETSAILSSGKSGNSLDFELDNEQNESGIGTATPPKDMTDYSFSSSNILSNINRPQNQKLIKSNSIISTSDQDDSLDMLSLYDCNTVDDDDDDNSHEIHNDSNYFDSNIQNYSDDCIKCSRESVKLNDKSENNKLLDIDSVDAVILRKKSDLKSTGLHENQRHAISFNNFRSLKTRSHIIEPTKKLITSSSSASNRDLIKYDDISSKESIGTVNSVNGISLETNKKKSTKIYELPSMSSASLHSNGNDNLNGLMIELTTKSNSAPILMKKVKKIYDNDNQNTLRYSRSQSDRYLAEIEAIEACKWLRAAGFPQYAQMYEDLQFPIDLSNVAKDHPILENDPLQSLYRRLAILNRCASMRLDSSYKHPQGPQKDDSDDESFALSENWTFQPQSRRWSRVGEGLELPPAKLLQKDKDDSSSKESSPERFDDDNSLKQYTGILHNFAAKNETETIRMRRTGSERLKDSAKAILRRVESIKSRRRKRQNRDGYIGSNSGGRGPVLDLALNGKNKSNSNVDKSKANINIVFSTPPSPSVLSPIHFYPRNLLNHNINNNNNNNNNSVLKISSGSDNYLHPNRLSPKHIPSTPRSCHSQHTSPLHFFNSYTKARLRENKSDESSYFSDSQDSNAGSDSNKLTLDFNTKKINRAKRFLQARSKVDDIGTHSDSECQSGRTFIIKDPDGKEPAKIKKLTRGGSLNLGKESKKYRDGFQNRSFRGKGSISKKTPKDSDESKPRKTPVVRWHSFQNHDKPENIFKKCCIKSPDDSKSEDEGIQFTAMSCGQLQVIRKLALVTLTGYMERYCPTHRSGWNWELPKFIKKIKTPDYKDRRVFGVPLLLIVQRTSQSLPIGIIAALRWLKINASDQVGLFRKSGVKSRIAKLKESIENLQQYEDCMELYDSQQAYDVADMLKQYFRELPDALLTAKMSETFVAIFQHLPPETRVEAVQAAVLLLPDENRDVLLSLLTFLNEVSSHSEQNQMTASNLAVCLAPSLFHSNIATGNPIAVSPRRTRKAPGQPNMKELAETKASHECLELMISQYKQVFTASPDRILKCNFGYMEESKPVPLEALGEGMPFHNWRGYLYECTSATIKEGKEKTRGWITMNSFDPNIEISYKKVGDGHPLRLWRTQTEVDSSANEILQLILNERSEWDSSLLKSQVVKKLDEHTEIFQYVFSGQIPTDFCVLRSWQVNLPKEACVIVETSIDHRDAKPMQGSIRGIVLASRYLIEPCGNGKSRIMNLSRVDLKGRTPEWYNKNYGHICSQHLTKIRSILKNNQNLENK